MMIITFIRAFLNPADHATSSRLLLMSWCLIGARPSTTTIVTALGLHSIIGLITHADIPYNGPYMMTSWNGNIFRVTGHLCGEFTGDPRGPWRGVLMFSLFCARIDGWVNNGEAGDLGRHHDVIVMNKQCPREVWLNSKQEMQVLKWRRRLR